MLPELFDAIAVAQCFGEYFRIPKNSILLEILSDHPISDDNFNTKTTELVDYLRESSNTPISKHHITIPPRGVPPPEIWLLGSSANNMPLALELKANFCLSLFHNHDHWSLAEKVIQFKEQYFDKFHVSPNVSISVLGFCSETNAKAKSLKETYSLKGLYPNNIDTAKECTEQILKLQYEYQIDEIIYLDICPFEERVFTLTALGEAFL